MSGKPLENQFYSCVFLFYFYAELFLYFWVLTIGGFASHIQFSTHHLGVLQLNYDTLYLETG